MNKFWVKSKINGNMVLIDASDPIEASKNDLAKAYFKSEVLAKYRSQPSKYQISDSCIKCKSEDWILQSCYTSSNNEIYCYLWDLYLLPDSEQEYWKIYNLKSPTGKANFLAIKRDFFCSFESFEKEKLSETLKKLQNTKIKIGSKSLEIWKPKEDFEQMLNEVMLPQVEEYKQYRDEFLLPLSRLVVEGFSKEKLFEWVFYLKEDFLKTFSSLTILENCLKNLSDEEKAKKTIKPLKYLHKEKSSRSSHGGKSVKINMISESKMILKEVTTSINDIIQIIKNN